MSIAHFKIKMQGFYMNVFFEKNRPFSEKLDVVLLCSVCELSADLITAVTMETIISALQQRFLLAENQSAFAGL